MIRKPWLRATQLLILIVTAATLSLWVSPQIMNRGQQVPSGWQIIRPPYDVSAFAIQGNIVWAGGKDGVVGLDRFSGRVQISLVSDPPLLYVRALLVDRNGILWIGHLNGVSRYDPSVNKVYAVTDGLPNVQVNALLETQDGRLWVGSLKGAVFSNGSNWHLLTEADGLADDAVNVMHEDHHGGIWFGSNDAPRGGVSYLKDGRWQYFSTANGLPHNYINALLEDHVGRIWVGTGLLDRGGLAILVYAESGWIIQQVLRASDGLAGDKVRSLFEDRDEVIWAGSEYDGLARLDAGKWHVLTVKDGLSDPHVSCFVQDEEGALWIGAMNGITHLTAKALADLRSPPLETNVDVPYTQSRMNRYESQQFRRR